MTCLLVEAAFRVQPRYLGGGDTYHIYTMVQPRHCDTFPWLLINVVYSAQGTDAAQEWERNRSKALREYLPKLILVGLIWITTLLVYM